jgi:hypothetical protein
MGTLSERKPKRHPKGERGIRRVKVNGSVVLAAAGGGPTAAPTTTGLRMATTRRHRCCPRGGETCRAKEGA